MDIGHASRLGKHKENVHTEAVFTDIYQLLSQIFDKLLQLGFVCMVFDSDEQLGDAVSLQERDSFLLRSYLSDDFIHDFRLVLPGILCQIEVFDN